MTTSSQTTINIPVLQDNELTEEEEIGICIHDMNNRLNSSTQMSASRATQFSIDKLHEQERTINNLKQQLHSKELLIQKLVADQKELIDKATPNCQHDNAISKSTSNTFLIKYYHVNRILEFLTRVRKILWNRLQPQRLKYGKNIVLGQCPLALLQMLLVAQPGCTIKTTYRNQTREGITRSIPFKHFIFSSNMPDLGGYWNVKYFRRGSTLFRSFYTRINFVINTEDDRVYGYFTQRTQHFGLNSYWWGSS